MSDLEASRQVDNITPALIGQVLAITLDATSRSYDLSALALGDGTVAPSAVGTAGRDNSADAWLYVNLIADVDFYYAFDKASGGTLDETQKLAAGGTAAAFTTNGAFLVPAKTLEPVRINRTRHKFLYLKGSGAGTLRLRASSQPSARAGVV